MKLSDAVRAARENDDWDRLIQAIPFAVFLRVRMEVKGERLTCVLPGDDRLVGNPWLPALHGGATAGFMECAAILFPANRTNVRPGASRAPGAWG